MDAETRTAAVSFSSQSPVQDRFWGPPTVLLHERAAVNLAVIRGVGSALMNHDPSLDSIVGRLSDIEIDSDARVGRATIHFDDDDTGNRALSKVKSGSLRGVSVRFTVDKAQVLREKDEWQSAEGQKFSGGARGLEVVTRWTPREISLTPTPADTSVGVGRETERERIPMFSEKTLERLKARGLEADAFSSEELSIKLLDKLDAGDAAREKRRREAPTVPPTPPPTEEPPAPAPTPSPAPAPKAAAREDEKARYKRFHELAKRAGDPDLAVKWIDGETSTEDAQREVIATLERRNPPPTGPVTERGQDQMDRTLIYSEAALSRRVGVEVTDVPKEMEPDVPNYISIAGAARMFLRAANVRNVDFMTDEQAITYAMTSGVRTTRYEDFRLRAAAAHVTGDFPLLFANLANKSLIMGAAEAQTTYQAVSTPKTLRDFRRHTFVQAGEIENLELTPDTMQFPQGTMSEKSEGMQLFSYSRKIGFGRQALINDDVEALRDMSRRLGNSSARTRNKLFWDHITQASGVGPTMTEDGEALFSASHPSGSNFHAHASTADLAQDSLAIGRKLMRLQKALTASKLPGRVTPSTAILNIPPTFLGIPAALEQAADELIRGSYIPTTAPTARVQWIQNLTPIVEPQLDATSALAWYLFASPSVIDTIAFATLAGSAGPMFRTWQVDDGLSMWFAAIDDFGVQALEHRGVFRSKGEA